MNLTVPLSRRRFLRHAALVTAGLNFASRPTWAAPATEVPAQRLARLSTGANICRWFRFPRRDSAAHFDNYIPVEEAEMIARMGIKHVRLCAAPGVVMDSTNGEIRTDRVLQLEAAIQRFHRAGLLVVLDIHNEDRPSELSPEWQDNFVKFWTALGTRMNKFDPDVTILEVINEPVFDKRENSANA